MTTDKSDTYSGNHGLETEDKLIFENDNKEDRVSELLSGMESWGKLGNYSRSKDIGLPNLSELETVRHYTRLSRKNYGIDSGIFPLGSCTMKYNPRSGERAVRFRGIGDVHPLQPDSSVQGILELMYRLERHLLHLTGFSGISLNPCAGAQGELTGIMMIKERLLERGESDRDEVLVPDTAHGTNPATATLCGLRTTVISSGEDGLVDIEDLERKISSSTAALMLTNPNTCGLYERKIRRIASLVHREGGYLYSDGANFNAIAGWLRPSDLGVDVMHLNLHKTFSTPHGGGGPGSGPVLCTDELEGYLPFPRISKEGERYSLDEEEGKSIGRIRAYQGQVGMFVRALNYIENLGLSGIREASGDAVLNANYIRAKLRGEISLAYEGYCMHEVLFDDSFLRGSGISTLDFVKSLIDEGYHPMTIYFPQTVKGAMLIEPTETESKRSLDKFIGSMLHLARLSVEGLQEERFKSSPLYAPRRRLDEVLASRKPRFVW